MANMILFGFCLFGCSLLGCCYDYNFISFASYPYREGNGRYKTDNYVCTMHYWLATNSSNGLMIRNYSFDLCLKKGNIWLHFALHSLKHCCICFYFFLLLAFCFYHCGWTIIYFSIRSFVDLLVLNYFFSSFRFQNELVNVGIVCKWQEPQQTAGMSVCILTYLLGYLLRLAFGSECVVSIFVARILKLFHFDECIKHIYT